MLVREITGIHYANRVKYTHGRKGQALRIDEQASVQTAQHTSGKNLWMTV